MEKEKIKFIKYLREFNNICLENGYSIPLIYKNVRDILGLNQEDFAGNLGISRKKLTCIENGDENDRNIRDLLVLFLVLKSIGKRELSILDIFNQVDTFRKLYKKAEKAVPGLVKLFRTKYDISQIEFGDLSKIDRSLLSLIENDKSKNPDIYIYKIWLAIVMFENSRVKKIIELIESQIETGKISDDLKLTSGPLYKRYLTVTARTLSAEWGIKGLETQRNILKDISQQSEQLIKQIKLLYKKLLKRRQYDLECKWTDFHVNHTIRKDTEMYFKALTNFLLVWDKAYGGDRFNHPTLKIAGIYINEILLKVYPKKRPYPNQLLADNVLEEWNEYWTNQEINLNERKDKFRDYEEVRPLTELEKLCKEKFGYKNTSELHNRYTYQEISKEDKEEIGILWDKMIKFEKSFYKQKQEALNINGLLYHIALDIQMDEDDELLRAIKFARRLFFEQKKTEEEIYQHFEEKYTRAIIKYWYSVGFNSDVLKSWVPTTEEIRNIYRGWWLTKEEGGRLKAYPRTNGKENYISVIDIDKDISEEFVKKIQDTQIAYITRKNKSDIEMGAKKAQELKNKGWLA